MNTLTQSSTRLILLVEDNPEDYATTVRALEKAGVHNPIRRCEDGDDALDYLYQRGKYDLQSAPKPGVILMDLNLPGTDGREVLDEINTQSLWRAVEHATDVVHREREIEERRAEVESFAYAAAHDLKSPLRKVSSFCQLLQMDYEGKLDEQADLFIDRIMDSTRTMTQLIDDLLEYTKSGRSTKPFATVDLAAVAKQVICNLEHEIEAAGAVVEVGNLPEVFGDEPALLQLLQNLTANAIKFSKEAERHVMISAEAIEDALQITVADNGIGIDPKYHKQIFEPLKRLHPKSAFEGSGIGLSTCKKVVEQHKGEIWVESEPGQGTKFHLTIPQHAPVGSSA